LTGRRAECVTNWCPKRFYLSRKRPGNEQSSHAYTEDQLVEQPAIGLFAELGWAEAGPPPTAGVAGEPGDAGLLGRETKGEVVLVPRLRAALEKLNPALPPEAITAAIDELTHDRSAMLLEQANREVYRLLKEGIPVSVADHEEPGRAELPLRPNIQGGAATPPYQNQVGNPSDFHTGTVGETVSKGSRRLREILPGSPE
jgi:hypothetical protein